MGDRALIVFKSGSDFSPVVYLHWHGSEVRDWLSELNDLMKNREGDLSYTCARFIGICHKHVKGNLSLGVWNLSSENIEEAFKNEKSFFEGYSHGDNGVFVIDVSNGNSIVNYDGV